MALEHPTFQEMTLAEGATRHAIVSDEIRRHDRAYDEGKPTISDFAYDLLERELQALEDQFPELAAPASPLRRVRAEPLSKFKRRQHRVPMLSLEKLPAAKHPTKDEEPDTAIRLRAQDSNTLHEFRSFDASLQKLLSKSSIDYAIEPKVDGVSISVTYRNGELELGMTRGDGEAGDDITANIRKIRAIPLRLDSATPPQLFEVRGEAYISLEDFEELNRKLSSAGEEEFPNARNATAGTLKQLDSRIVAKRPISAVFYGIGAVEGVSFETHSDALNTLERFGLPVQKFFRVCHGIDEVLACYSREIVANYDDTRDLRQSTLYDIDGVVIKVNSMTDWPRIPFKSRAPGYAIVHKPVPWISPTETRIKGITVQVGRTGVLTPVAELESVFLQGSTISRATLHNEDEIHRKDIRIGDIVEIRKAGMVIPEVIGVVLSKRLPDLTEFDLFKHVEGKCPACGGPISKDASSNAETEMVAWRCQNIYGCPAQVTRRLEHFAQRKALDIEGLGGIVAEKLVERSLVRAPLDLFSIDLGKLASLNLGSENKRRVFGEKNAAKIKESLDRARTLPLHRWLMAFAIPDLGEQTAREIAAAHQSLESVTNSSLLRKTVELHESREKALEVSPHVESNRSKTTSERDSLRQKWSDFSARADSVGQELIDAGFAYLPKGKKQPREAVAKIGPVAARATLDFFESAPGRTLLSRLTELNIHPSVAELSPPSDASSAGIGGKSFVLTGTLPTLSRTEAEELIRNSGGTVSSSVSRSTDYLLCGENAGSKLEKARQLGLKILTESELLSILGQKSKVEKDQRADLFLQ